MWKMFRQHKRLEMLSTEKIDLEKYTDEEIKDVAVKINKLIDDLNNEIKNISLAKMKGLIIQQRDIVSGDFSLRHGLGFVPSSMVIVKQVGGGVVTSRSNPWSDKEVFLNNSSGTINELKVYLE